MKPLLITVVALSLLLTIHAVSQESETAPQYKEPVVEAEDPESHIRLGRCTTCSSSNLSLKTPQAILAALQAIPGAEVHTQQSFEGCSTEKGCAGLKVKDGKVIQRYGNVDAFNAAAAADVNNEFKFHAGLAKNVLEGSLPDNGPFWWMNQDSPFKTGAKGGNFQKYTKSSSSSYTSSGASNAALGGSLDLAVNPFLNGDLALGAGQNAAAIKPNFESSSYEASSFGTSNKEIDLSKNPFLNGGFSAGQVAAVVPIGFEAGGVSAVNQGFGASGVAQNFDASAINAASAVNAAQGFGSSYGGFAAGNKVSTGYTGSSPTPFVATPVSGINLIQNEKASEFDFEQQQQTQQSIDKLFQTAGSVGIDTSGGDLQQTCASEGYSCVIKTQCANGVAYLQINPRKQYCNVRTEICCRIEIIGVVATSQGIGATVNQGSSYADQSNSFGANAFEAQGQSTLGLGTNFGLGATGVSSSFGKGSYGAQTGATNGFGSVIKGVTATNAFGPTIVPTIPKFGATNGFKATGQTNLIETDSLSAGSLNTGIYRPGAIGTNLKPGIPYLPPVDNSKSGTNIVSSTVYPTIPPPPPTFVTTPRPISVKPTYLPPISSTAAPGYLPPVGEQTINRETIVPPNPTYSEGSLILDENRFPIRPIIPAPIDVPVGCAAALKCTPIEFCTADGIVSNTTVILTREQDAYRVPLTDCKDIETGRIGKCCRDPYYTDPWPTNQLGRWVPGVFGGNDGKYVPDSRVSSNNIRPTVTVRPPVTGSVLLNNFITTKPTVSPFGPNQVTSGFPSSTPTPFLQKGQFGQGQIGIGGQGQYSQAGQGQLGIIGQGQIGSGSQVNTAYSQGQFGQKGQGQIIRGQVAKGQGQFVSQGQGQVIKQGQGQYSQGAKGQFGIVGQGVQTQFGIGQKGIQGQGIGVIQGQGFASKKGQGQFVSQGVGVLGSQGQGTLVSQGVGVVGNQGQGTLVSQGVGALGTQGQGTLVSQGVGALGTQGQGTLVSRGQGALVSQGFGTGIRQGQGQYATQGQGALVSQGVGALGTQGQGAIVSQGQGAFISQGVGALGTQGQGALVSQGQGGFVSQGVGGLGSQELGILATKGQGTLISQGQGALVSQGVGAIGSQGVGALGSHGQGLLVSRGQGALVSQGVGGYGTQGQGAIVSQGIGALGTQGQGALVSQGFGTGITQGQGQYESQGQGAIVSQGFGQGVRQGQGQYVSQGQGQLVSQGGGQYVSNGQGLLVSQGFGQNIRQGQGFSVSQGNGIGVENEYGESVQRVFLQKYNGGGKCGLLNGQRPNGNRKNLEVDFAEIPWQAMVLLQTNKSLLCGGVITRPDVVVTSAACVEGLEAKNVLIKGGEWKLGIDDEPLPFQIVQVKTILRHPLYKPGGFLYDAAILVLTENLRFANNIYPICLPGADETLDAYYSGAGQCIVTGWGKQVLQAHLSGSIMHSLNVSLITPGDCQAKLSSDYPHLLDQYNEDSCVCGEPTNPLNNICRVDIGSALACTTGDGHYVFRGVYSWDTGCQTGNQLAAFYRFDLEWYQWAIGLIESVRFAQFSTITKITTGKISGGVKGFNGVKGTQFGVKGSVNAGDSGVKELSSFGVSKGQFGFGQGLLSQGQFNQFTEKLSSGSQSGFGAAFNFSEIKPITNGFSATYSEKKVFQTEPKIITYTTKPEIFTFTTKPEIVTYTTKPEIVTYTTKPEIVTFTTKPEIFTYTTKPKIVTYTTKPKIVTYTTKPKIITYTTKPQIITYETSGSRTNPQYVAPGVTFNPSFSELVGKHQHSAKCKCLENK